MISVLRVLHLFGVILWIGGLLAVTSALRIASGQSDAEKRSSYALARRMLSAGANAGAAVAIVLGVLLLIAEPKLLHEGWLHAKLLLVLVLIFLHGRLFLRARVLESEPSYPATAKQFATLHGAFSLILLVILFLVLVRPF
jgi:putative membrane protein